MVEINNYHKVKPKPLGYQIIRMEVGSSFNYGHPCIINNNQHKIRLEQNTKMAWKEKGRKRCTDATFTLSKKINQGRTATMELESIDKVFKIPKLIS